MKTMKISNDAMRKVVIVVRIRNKDFVSRSFNFLLPCSHCLFSKKNLRTKLKLNHFQNERETLKGNV